MDKSHQASSPDTAALGPVDDLENESTPRLRSLEGLLRSLGYLINVFALRLLGTSPANMAPSKLGVPGHTELFKRLIASIDQSIQPTYVKGTSITWVWAITQTLGAIRILRDEIETQTKFVKKRRRVSLPHDDHMFVETLTKRSSPPKWIEIEYNLMALARRESVRFADMIKDLIRRRSGKERINTFEQIGEIWQVNFQTSDEHREKGLFKDHVGFPFLTKLLECPDTPITVAEIEGTPQVPGGGIEMLDDEAMENYSKRIRDLASSIEEAKKVGDSTIEAVYAKELDQVVAELNRSSGLARRSRRTGDARQNAKKRVTMAIRRAIKSRISEEMPELARHLDECIQMGAEFKYSPPPNTPTWYV